MRRKPTNPASEGFISLVREGMERTGISLNELARLAKISPAFLSRILNRERGLPPSDTVILRLGRLLDLEPPDRLLIEAGRTPEDLKPVLNNPQVPILLRASGELSETDLQKVINVSQALALRQRRKRKRR